MTTLACPNHKGSFDCTPFCTFCEGEQEIELSESQDAVWEVIFHYEDYSINVLAYGPSEQAAIDYADERVPEIKDTLIETYASLQGILE
jgi:hypothetical protein